MAITFDDIREIALALPGVLDGTSYRTPALRLKDKFLARLREDDETVAFRVGFDERDLLMAAKPDVFFITEHYRGYPAVLLRLAAATKADAAEVVRLAHESAAAKRKRS